MRHPCKPTLKYYSIMADNYARFASEATAIGNKSRAMEYAKREIRYRNLACQLNFEESADEYAHVS